MSSPDPEQLLTDGDFVRDLARALVMDPHSADDLAQDVWLAFLRRGPAPGTPRRNWIVTVLRNTLRQHVRANARRKSRETSAAAREFVPSAAEVLEREAVRAAVVDELLRLEPLYQQPLLLYFYDRLPPRKIAQVLSIPVETARTRIRRGIELLRKAMDARARSGGATWAVALLPWIQKPAEGTILTILAGAFWMKTTTKLIVTLAALLFFAFIGVFYYTSNMTPSAPSTEIPSLAESSTPGSGAESSTHSAPNSIESRRVEAPAVATVQGRVTDLAGNPVAGASILAIPGAPTEVIDTTSSTIQKPGMRRLKSGADGRFSITLQDGEKSLSLYIEARGYSPELRSTVEPGPEWNIPMERSRSLTGLVVDDLGNPVPGATVTISILLEFAKYERTGISDATGRYRVDEMPSLRCAFQPSSCTQVYKTVRAAGYAPSSFRSGFGLPYFLQKQEPSQDFVLSRGVEFSGRVLDSDSGQPITGARVVLWTDAGTTLFRIRGNSIENPYAQGILDENTTNARGEFRFEHAPASLSNEEKIQTGEPPACKIAIVANGFAPLGAELASKAPGSTLQRDFTLDRTVEIQGRVVDEQGQPCERVQVFVESAEKYRTAIPRFLTLDMRSGSMTKSDGVFRLQNVPGTTTGGLQYTLRAQEWTDDSAIPGNVTRRAELKITTVPGASTVVPDIVLKAPASRTGVPAEVKTTVDVTVSDERGNPVPGAYLSISPASSTTGYASAVSGADGRARLSFRYIALNTKSESSGDVTIVAVAEGFGRAESAKVNLESTPVPPVRFVLKRAFSITGRVLRADGQPPLPAFVTAVISGRNTDATDAILAHAVTREDGSFRLENLPEGKSTIMASHIRISETGSKVSVKLQLENVSAGTENLILQFVDDLDAPMGSVDLTVTDAASGRPVKVFVASLSRGLRTVAAESVIPGRARVERVAAGEYTLRVHARGYANAVLSPCLVPADRIVNVAVQLHAGATVKGTVHCAEGAIPENLTVCACPADTLYYYGMPVQYADVLAGGKFEIPNLGPGIWRLTVDWKRDPDDGRVYAAKYAFPEEILVSVKSTDTEVRCDPELLAGGTLNIKIESPLLPKGMIGSAGNTDAQVDLLEKIRTTVKTSDGRTLYRLNGSDSFGGGERSCPVGDIVVTLEVPGREPMERRLTITRGKRAAANFEFH